MFCRREVANKPDVAGPWELNGILCTANHKLFIRTSPRRFNEEDLKRGLPVLCIRTQIREVTSVARALRNWTVNGGISTAVESCHPPSAQTRLQFAKRGTTCVAQHQVERCQAVSGNVVDVIAGPQSIQGNRCIKIIKKAHARTGLENEVRSRSRVGTVGGDDGAIALLDRSSRFGQNVFPFFV